MLSKIAASLRICLAAGLLWTCAAAAGSAEKCRLPRRVTVSAPDGLALDDLAAQCAAHRREFARVPEQEAAFLRFVLDADGAPEHPQGYLLEASDRHIAIRARTAEGLFNGMQALNDLLRRSADGVLAEGRRSETPRFDERALCFSVARRSAVVRDVNRIKQRLRLLAALRCNRAIIEFGDNFPCPPEMSYVNRGAMDEETIKQLVDFAAENFIRIVPMVQPKTGCPPSPEERNKLRAIICRQCGLLRAEECFFRIDWSGLAEHRRTCPKCRDSAPEKLLAEHLGMLAGCAAENRVRGAFILLGFPDDLAAKLPGMLPPGTPLYGLKTGGRPPDTALAGEPETLLREITRSRSSGSKRFIMLTDRYVRNCDFAAPLNHLTPTFMAGLVQGSFAMWSPERPDQPEDPVEYFSIVQSGKISPLAFHTATPVAIWPQLTAEAGASGAFPRFADQKKLEAMRRALLGSPERFEIAVCFGRRYYGALLPGVRGAGELPEQIEIPLGGAKAEGIALLLSCTPPQNPDEFDPARNGRRAFEFCNVAMVEVGYADGTSLPRRALRYRWDISAWSDPCGGYNRRTACRGRDADGRNFRLDAVTIKTDPNKPLKYLRIRTLGAHGIAPAVFAVSLLDMTGGSLPTPKLSDELLRINFRLPRK